MNLTRLCSEGYLTVKDLEDVPGVPSRARLEEGPVAILECIQDIPCNPCEAVCKQEAVTVGHPITNLPVLDGELCNGCGLCIAVCPGLAVFVVDLTYSETEATVAFPHEYLPLPKKGDVVEAVDRRGEVVCQGRVVRVQNPRAFDCTPVITLAVPKEMGMEVRGMRRLKDNG
jgi:Fe-S-cluster-containing hydrogenase component 2